MTPGDQSPPQGPSTPYGAPPGFGQPPQGYATPPAYLAPYGQLAGPDMAYADNGQPVRLASAGARVGSFFLSILLIIVTLGIGYLVWTLILWGRAQTPSKQILKQRVVYAANGQPVSWGRMFVRGFLVGGLLNSILNGVTFSIYFLVDAFMVFSSKHRRLTDRISGTLVAQE